MRDLDSALASHPDGATVTVLVVPRAGVTSIADAQPGRLRVRVAAPPVDGAANAELIRFAAACCGVGRGDVEVLRGVRGREKTLLVRGRSAVEVRAALGGCAQGSKR
jgi:uncharacterized protein